MRGGRGFRAAAILAIATAAWPVAGAAASPADVTVEGEAMTLPAVAGGPAPDAAASGSSAQRIATNSTAQSTVTTGRSSVHLFVRARGDDCQGAPAISVRVDGRQWWSGPVSTSGYRDIGVRVSIPAGAHTVAVSMTNDNAVFLAGFKVCDRSVLVDSITFVTTPFSPTGWRNQPLADDAPVAPGSAAIVGDLVSQIDASDVGVWVNTTWYSTPIYTVSRDQPTVRVAGPPQLAEQFAAVPLPPDAMPAPGSDATLVVWQPSTDTMWEFWGLARDRWGNWSARYGGRMPDVSRNEGQFGFPPGPRFGASATSIALMAGTPRIEELKRGVIDHAIDLGVTAGRGRDGWCWPAQRTDAGHWRRDAAAIPAGTRFRFPAGFDLEAYAADPAHPMTRYALMTARAIQRYGMVVRDSGGTHPGFWAEDPAPTGGNPYGGPTGLFEGRYPNKHELFANFPWSRLQVVAQPPGAGCQDDPDVDG
ncbi:MAG TPA: carbohydrate-binding domain-containing protein [Thermoleophilaceae bacterium]